MDALTPVPVWQRAYEEINQFEALLAAHGTRIVKIFLHVTQEEQDKRLLERLETPWKRWKTGLDDYHNRSQRAGYWTAYHEMFERCSTPGSPWTVIEAGDKKYCRIKGLEKIIEILSEDVDLSYPEISPEVLEKAEKALGPRVHSAGG